MKEHIFPKKILKSNTNCEHLLKKQPLQIGIAEKTTTFFKEEDFVVLDFGQEMCGGVRILAFYADKVKVRL